MFKQIQRLKYTNSYTHKKRKTNKNRNTYKQKQNDTFKNSRTYPPTHTHTQAHEIIVLEILTLLLDKPTDDSVEVNYYYCFVLFHYY